MQIGYFTERPYRWLDEDDVLRNKAFFAMPNDRFDHIRAAEDYNYWLDEYSAAEELGFEVLDPIVYSLAPGDFTPQCLTLNEVEADYAYLANIAGSNVAMLNSCGNANVETQFVANVWGYDEAVMAASGANADGVVLAVRTDAIWTDDNPGMDTVREIAAASPEGAEEYRQLSYLAGVCSAMYMAEAIEWALENGGATGENIRAGMYAMSAANNGAWVPEGFEGVCRPSGWTDTDHRGMMSVPIYRGSVTGPTEGRDISEMFSDGTLALEHIDTIELERRPEWLGY